jgi:AcrR family transcriptional regulator
LEIVKLTEKKIICQIQDQNLINERHRQIIRAASQLFAKRGYHKTTMREISRASKINLSQLYQYISSKDDVLYLFYKDIYKRVHGFYLSLQDTKDESPINQLRVFIYSILGCISKNVEEFLTMYTESRHLKRESLHAVLALENEHVHYVEELIIRGIDKGAFKTNDPFMAANIIQYSLMIESLRGWNMKKYTFNEFVESITDFIFNGLGIKENEN